MSQVIELARFKVAEDSEAEFLAARPAMLRAVTGKVAGLDEIALVRLDDGTWVDVVLWSSREDAERGAEIAASLPEAQRWLSHIAADVSMDLGEVMDRAAA